MKGLRPWFTRLVFVRPGFVGNGFGFVSGVIILFALPALPPFWSVGTILLILVTAAWRFPCLRPLAFAVLGFAWAGIHACRILCDPFPQQYTGRDLDLAGSVATLPEDAGEAVRFMFRVEEATGENGDLGFKGLVRLSWYREPPALRVGERWHLKARLRRPHGFSNPGGFDYERWLFLQGVRATGSVRRSDHNRLLDRGPGIYFIDRWRQELRDHIGAVIGDDRGGGLVRALVLGDRGGLGDDQWDALTRTGTNHLIAISGLHVGLVAALLFLLVRRAWVLSARLCLAVAAPRASAVIAFLGALGYSGLAGFAVSTQRALIMLAVVLGAQLWARTVRPALGLMLALIGVLILDPAAVLSYGFWLSFGAVAALLFALGRRLPVSGIWSRWGRAQWAVALGLMPLLLFMFGRASLVAPLVNLIVVPIFSLLLLPAVLLTFLLSFVSGFDPPLHWTAQFLEWGLDLLEVVSVWPWASAELSGRPFWVWAAAFFGTILILSPRGLPGRAPGLVMLLPVVLVRPPVPAFGEADFTLLDVGQGLSAVVRTQRHTLVYDAGPAFGKRFNTGKAVVLPFLREQGVRRVDILILSHADRDHSGGFVGLSGKIDIDRVLSGEPDELTDSGAVRCRSGDKWTWDGVEFELLHPPGPGWSGNDSSCVLRVSASGTSLLLPGDIERGVEAELVAQHRRALSSTVLVAAHHGSSSSSSQAFLEAVSPRFVLYSSGFANRFGFPVATVRQRVSDAGCSESNTAHSGAIGFVLGPAGLLGPVANRERHGRLWTHRPDGSAESF